MPSQAAGVSCHPFAEVATPRSALLLRPIRFTTSRISRSSQRHSRDRDDASPSVWKRHFRATVGHGGRVRRDQVLQALNELTPKEEAQPAAATDSSLDQIDPTSDEQRLQVEFVANVRGYLFRESPTNNWRNRREAFGRGGVVRRRATDGSLHRYQRWAEVGDDGTHIGQIDFHPEHAERLLLPSPIDRSKDYLRDRGPLGYRMRAHVQFLTTPSADTAGTTLLLHFDNKRYLIGSVAEGLQRACVESGTKMLRVSEIFMTGRARWSNTGGLIGMVLTLADSFKNSREEMSAAVRKRAHYKAMTTGVKNVDEYVSEQVERSVSGKLTFLAPKNTNHTIATARRFVFRSGLPLEVHEVNDRNKVLQASATTKWDPYWADDFIKVWAMAISSTTPASSGEDETRAAPHSSDAQDALSPGREPEVTHSGLSPEEEHVLTAKAVVGEMFGSSWTLDALYPTKLSQVRLPAKIFVRNPDGGGIEKYRGPYPGHEDFDPENDVEVLVRKPWPGALINNLPPCQPANEAISYIVKNHTQRGRFNPKNAKRLKINPGPDYARLTRGESVRNEDGEIVTPEQVLGPPSKGCGFAIIDLPDASFVNGLVERAEWGVDEVMDGIGAFVWSLGPGVIHEPKLQAFMQQHSDVEHFVASTDLCANDLAMKSAAASTVKLGVVDDKRWQPPVHSNVASTPGLPSGIRVAERGQKFLIAPTFEILDQTATEPLDIEKTKSEVPLDVVRVADACKERLRVAKADIDAWASTLPDKDAEVIALGTGSALPSKYRNVSGTLVRVPGWGSMLFDAGENTLGQLRRVFTEGELEEVFGSLKCIFISHMHADHHLGIAGVIKAWYDTVHKGIPADTLEEDMQSRFTGQKRLAVVAEPAMCSWLREYAEVEDYGFSRIAPIFIGTASNPDSYTANLLNWYIDHAELTNLEDEEVIAKRQAAAVQPEWLGFSDIQAVLVRHCHGARAYSATLASGFKVSYSGDCRPSKGFATIGKGSTVCIHEATFDDELRGDAKAKYHSTTSEALSIAQAMGARTCVLTHFSQRYQKLPVLEYDGIGADLPPQADKWGPDEMEEDSDDDAELVDAGADMETLPDQAVSDSSRIDGASMVERSAHDGASANGTDGDAGAELPSESAKASRRQRSERAGDDNTEAVKFKLTTDMKACVAFDYMRVKVGEIAEMQYYTPALLKLFETVDGSEVGSVGGADGEANMLKKKRARRYN